MQGSYTQSTCGPFLEVSPHQEEVHSVAATLHDRFTRDARLEGPRLRLKPSYMHAN